MKKITYFIIAVLAAALLQQPAVRAAEQEAVTLTAEEGKAALEIEIPDSSEGITTFRLRVRIEEATENLDPEEPLKFESAENVQAELQETRYNAEKGYFTIYLSGTDKITDKSLFMAGYLVPNAKDGTPASITISVKEDGLQYVDGTGDLNDKVTVQPSTAELYINQSTGTPEENPDNPDDGADDDADDGASGGVSGGTSDGAGDGSAGNLSGGQDKPADSGSGADSHGGSDTDSAQGVADSAGGAYAGVQTGDNANPALLCVTAGFSAFAVISVLMMRRAGTERKKPGKRKLNK